LPEVRKYPTRRHQGSGRQRIRQAQRSQLCGRPAIWWLGYLPAAKGKWRAEPDSVRTPPGMALPEVMFRIVHEAPEGNGPAAYRDQAVEVALGPKDAFKNGNVGNVVRRVPKKLVVCAVPPSQANPRPLKVPREPRVKELLLQAREWQRLLNSGEVRNQAEIAQREGITRARVTQIMSLLNLAPDIQEHILTMPKTSCRPAISEHSLRPIVRAENPQEQLTTFQQLIQS